jgi:hypothetical protein
MIEKETFKLSSRVLGGPGGDAVPLSKSTLLWGVAEKVKSLPRECKALSANPSASKSKRATVKKKQRTRKCL